MKSILCFGDSLTWGYNPVNGMRHSYGNRLTTYIQNTININNSNHIVINAGLPGRTTIFDDPYFSHKNGFDSLQEILETNSPIDVVVIILGTNDLKGYMKKTCDDVAIGLLKIISFIRTTKYANPLVIPKILLVCPPCVNMTLVENNQMMKLFFKNTNMNNLHQTLEILSQSLNVQYLNGSVVSVGVDGVHLDEIGNLNLGILIGNKLKEML